jgi:carboxyl-terminal processing protease
MKSSILLFSLIIFKATCLGQTQSAPNYHPIVQAAKETSLYSNSVDWTSVNAQFEHLTEGKTDVEGMKDGLQFLINSLGDKHATFRSAHDYSIIVNYTGPMEESNRDSDFVNNVINDVTSSFSYQLLDQGIGYLKVVGIGPGDLEAQANQIRDGLKELKKQDVNKWILDLRYNGGGNMNPMMAGLAPLVGEGAIGGAVDADNQMVRNYKIVDGQFYDTDNLVCPMDNNPVVNPDEKVAVLLSRYTISSGELVAVAFKGRDNTLFLGEETAGYTTGNGWAQLTDDLILNISESVYVDRDNVVYDKKVGVDKEIEFQHSQDLTDDRQIDAARLWLNK